MMGSDMMGAGMGTWMLLSMVVSFLVILGLVLLAAWGTQRGWKRGLGRSEETALEILKKRYVRGEISKEEYEEKKRDIA
ncbi:MAG: SHOCT domain-containing protein [Nitrospirae bacterium]|nr:SHOCT domain-containing protein [Nitrospirota bacterium]